MVCAYVHAAASWGLGGMLLQVKLDALRLLLKAFWCRITDSQPFLYSNPQAHKSMKARPSVNVTFHGICRPQILETTLNR